MSRLLYAAPLAVFALIAAALGWATLSREAPPQAGALVGLPAPAFALEGLSEAHGGLSSEALGEGVALVNVFASWCTPCAAEHPLLMRLAREGAVIHGVVWRDAPQAAQAFIDERGDPYQLVGLDRDGRWGQSFGVSGAPETLVIVEGVVAAHVRGPLSPAIIDAEIRPHLGGLGAR